MTTITPHPVYGSSYGGTATENYERYFVPSIGAPFAADLVTAANLRAGERVLDVACGTGIVTRLAAQRIGESGTVAGLDINAGMLAVARTVPVKAGSATARWYETSAEAMPLPDASFDVVLCQLGLQFIADKASALREMRRVLSPGGRVLLSVPTPTAFFDGLETVLSRHVPAASGFVQMVFSLNDPAELDALVRGAGFADITVRLNTKVLDLPSPRDFMWQYIHCTPLASMVASAERDVAAAMERDIEVVWQPWRRNGGLRYEQGMIVATASAPRTG